MTTWTVESLLQHITDSDYAIQGYSKSKPIRNVSSLHTGTRDDVSFCSSEKYRGMISISQSNAGVILCKKVWRGSYIQIIRKDNY